MANLPYEDIRKKQYRVCFKHFTENTEDLNEIQFISPEPGTVEVERKNGYDIPVQIQCSVQLEAAEFNSEFPKSVSTEETASNTTSEKKRKNLSLSLPPNKRVSVGEAASRSGSAKVRKSLKSVKKTSASEPKMRIVYEAVRKRLRRRILAEKRQIVDFTPKAKKIFQEALRLRKQLHITKSTLQRYEIENALMRTELDLYRTKINLLESKYILSDLSIENDMKV